MLDRRQPNSTEMNDSPKFMANFLISANPFLLSSLEIAEYREELMDLEVGRMRGGILENAKLVS